MKSNYLNFISLKYNRLLLAYTSGRIVIFPICIVLDLINWNKLLSFVRVLITAVPELIYSV